MFLDRLVPTSDTERDLAANGPGSFWFSEFLRGAAVMALILTVWLVVWPLPTFEKSGTRLYMVGSWALLNATVRLWAARKAHLQSKRVGFSISSTTPIYTR